jgi:hypothetical protein
MIIVANAPLNFKALLSERESHGCLEQLDIIADACFRLKAIDPLSVSSNDCLRSIVHFICTDYNDVSSSPSVSICACISA